MILRYSFFIVFKGVKFFQKKFYIDKVSSEVKFFWLVIQEYMSRVIVMFRYFISRNFRNKYVNYKLYIQKDV